LPALRLQQVLAEVSGQIDNGDIDAEILEGPCCPRPGTAGRVLRQGRIAGRTLCKHLTEAEPAGAGNLGWIRLDG
jgi:hypothetical protein